MHMCFHAQSAWKILNGIYLQSGDVGGHGGDVAASVPLEIGFCVLHFLSTLSDYFLTGETDKNISKGKSWAILNNL